MKRLFEIDENEKKRILEMHENATKNLYLSEQAGKKTCLTQETIAEYSTFITAMGGDSNLCKILGTSNNPLVGDTYYKYAYFHGFAGGQAGEKPIVKVFKLDTNFNLVEISEFQNIKSVGGWFTSGGINQFNFTVIVPKDGKINDNPAYLVLDLIESNPTRFGLDSTKYLEYLVHMANTYPAYKKTLEYVVNFSKTASSEGVRKKIQESMSKPTVSQLLSELGLNQ